MMFYPAGIEHEPDAGHDDALTDICTALESSLKRAATKGLHRRDIHLRTVDAEAERLDEPSQRVRVSVNVLLDLLLSGDDADEAVKEFNASVGLLISSME